MLPTSQQGRVRYRKVLGGINSGLYRELPRAGFPWINFWILRRFQPGFFRRLISGYYGSRINPEVT